MLPDFTDIDDFRADKLAQIFKPPNSATMSELKARKIKEFSKSVENVVFDKLLAGFKLACCGL